MTAVPLPKPALRLARAASPAPVEDRPEDYYALVRRVAARVARRSTAGTTVEDMTQAGMVGVLKQWSDFDPTLSCRTTWVESVAKYAMLNALRQGAGHFIIRIKARVAAGDDFAYPTVCRIKQQVKDGSNYFPGHYHPADYRAPATATDPTDFLATAETLAGRELTRRERGVLLLCFVRGMTQIEAAGHLGVSHQRASKIFNTYAAACLQAAAKNYPFCPTQGHRS